MTYKLDFSTIYGASSLSWLFVFAISNLCFPHFYNKLSFWLSLWCACWILSTLSTKELTLLSGEGLISPRSGKFALSCMVGEDMVPVYNWRDRVPRKWQKRERITGWEAMLYMERHRCGASRPCNLLTSVTLNKCLFLSEPQLPCLHNRNSSNVYRVVLYTYAGERCEGLAHRKSSLSVWYFQCCCLQVTKVEN